MKRPKGSSPYEEQPDPMRDLNIEFEGPDDDIIDLEDIIEMPSGPIDEDEDLDLDVDMFASDLEAEPGKAARPLMKEQAQGLSSEEEDLLKSFGDEPEEDEKLFEPVASRGPEKKSMEEAESQVFEDEESLLDEFMDKPAMTETGMGAEEKIDLKARAAAAMKVPEDAPSAEVESEAAIPDESFESAASEAAALMIAPTPPAADLSQMAEELIGRIESRLQEHIRIMVESMLPDLVRLIINEEIEKLKKEL
ncbi:MAG: hypothetical protein ABSF90_04905 [Syntrophobacteraceae bacterium]|jgi:activator of HSP90 ATPase